MLGLWLFDLSGVLGYDDGVGGVGFVLVGD